MTTRRASAFHSIVDDNNQVMNLPSGSPAGTPADSLGSVQGAPLGYPVSVVGKSNVISVTLTPDTSIMADNDVIAGTQEVPDFFRVAGGVALLHSIVLLDEADQAQDVDIIFMNADGSVGAENAAYAPSDAIAAQIIGSVLISTTDYSDANTSQTATKSNVGLMLKAGPNTTSVWIAAVCRSGTPTYTASSLKLKLGVFED